MRLRSLLLTTVLFALSSARPHAAGAFTAPALVKDVNVGAGDSAPVVFYPIAGKLVFFASDGVSGTEPWTSDGTAAGTFQLRDVWPGANGGFNPGCPSCNAVSNGTIVYFSASDGTGGSQLWRTDGTSAGTIKVYAGTVASGLGVVGSRVFFTSGTGQLYVSDGTSAGTVAASSNTYATGTDIADVGGIAYYSGSDGFSGNELFRSDGTQGGTFRVKDLNPDSNDANPTYFTNVGGTLYFSATNGTGGGLYKTDGTSAGTILLRQGTITGGAVGSRPQFLPVNGIVYFIGSDNTFGQELWRTDGTPAGTFMVKDVYPGAGGGLVGSALCAVGNTIFFMGADDTHSAELWKSDGTAAGTVMVKDIAPGISSSFPRALANINGTLFFRAQASFAAGDQPWTSDGTAAGTQQWAAIRPADASGARDFTLAGGTLYFAANDGTHGLELWAAGPTLGVAPGQGPSTLSLAQSQPNPMRAQAAITYAIAVGQHVTLKLFDAQGREVQTLVDQMQTAGLHRAYLDSRGLASGLYFYRLRAGSEVRERKLVIQN